jgi:predicted transcriptional regulator
MQTNPSAIVAATVRAELARRGQSQEALGQILNLSQSAVSRRLSGRKAFDVAELAKIAEHLEVPMAVFLGGVAA